MKLVGLMSGTSLDGIDACLLEVEGEDPTAVAWRVRHFLTRDYSREERALLQEGMEQGGPATLTRLHGLLGEWLAETVLLLLGEARVAPGEIAAVGSHGQTIWHIPPEKGGRGFTLQLGDPATVAERTGIPVVSDLRSRDMAAGGQGAPLVPWADRVLLSRPGVPRALQNLGGMGNVTWLPPREGPGEPFAFDTGPGVALLDAAAVLATGGGSSHDREGAMAARGEVDRELLERLLQDPFFREEPPRSTGRERFGPPLVAALARERGLVPGVAGLPQGEVGQGWCDLLATLAAFTAESVADAYRRWVRPRGMEEVVLAGGGARNPVLVKALAAALDPLPVLTGAEALGIDPDAREAAAFALLAWAHLRGVPGNIPGATGAAGPRVLGSFTPGTGSFPHPSPRG